MVTFTVMNLWFQLKFIQIKNIERNSYDVSKIHENSFKEIIALLDKNKIVKGVVPKILQEFAEFLRPHNLVQYDARITANYNAIGAIRIQKSIEILI